jgi:hypothetical protein
LCGAENGIGDPGSPDESLLGHLGAKGLAGELAPTTERAT